MPDTIDTLMLLVDVAVAVAGFSGVVVVFGRRARGAWSVAERARLRNLIVASFAVLFFSLGALLLLHAGVSEQTTWRVGGVAWATISFWQATVAVGQVRSVPKSDPARPNLAMVSVLLGILVLLALTNLWNAFLTTSVFWPFLAGLAWLLAIAWYSFSRLLFIAGDGGQDA